MYSMTEEDRIRIMAKDTLAGYPGDLMAEAIERKIAVSLPVIPGLDPDMTTAERYKVFATSIKESQAAFVMIHGGLFGYEEKSAKEMLGKVVQSHCLAVPEYAI